MAIAPVLQTNPPQNEDDVHRREIDTDPHRVRREDNTADTDPLAVERREIASTLPKETK